MPIYLFTEVFQPYLWCQAWEMQCPSSDDNTRHGKRLQCFCTIHTLNN